MYGDERREKESNDTAKRYIKFRADNTRLPSSSAHVDTEEKQLYNWIRGYSRCIYGGGSLKPYQSTNDILDSSGFEWREARAEKLERESNEKADELVEFIKTHGPHKKLKKCPNDRCARGKPREKSKNKDEKILSKWWQKYKSGDIKQYDSTTLILVNGFPDWKESLEERSNKNALKFIKIYKENTCNLSKRSSDNSQKEVAIWLNSYKNGQGEKYESTDKILDEGFPEWREKVSMEALSNESARKYVLLRKEKGRELNTSEDEITLYQWKYRYREKTKYNRFESTDKILLDAFPEIELEFKTEILCKKIIGKPSSKNHGMKCGKLAVDGQYCRIHQEKQVEYHNKCKSKLRGAKSGTFCGNPCEGDKCLKHKPRK
jgi:hypothetical protein